MLWSFGTAARRGRIANGSRRCRVADADIQAAVFAAAPRGRLAMNAMWLRCRGAATADRTCPSGRRPLGRQPKGASSMSIEEVARKQIEVTGCPRHWPKLHA